MRRVYLVRHASPAVRPDVPSREWSLSDRGIEEARALADVARAWDLRAVYCGAEPKMRATALLLAEASLLPVHVVESFDESRIGRFIANADAFNEIVRAILQTDDSPARGVESGAEAATRFAGGLKIIAGGPFPAAIISGGRILTSYLVRNHRGIDDAFAFWRAIPFPGWTCIDLDDASMLVELFR